MEEPDFWNNPERSQELMKELKSKKDDVEIYHRLTSQMEDMEDRKSTRLNSSHIEESRMPSSA